MPSISDLASFPFSGLLSSFRGPIPRISEPPPWNVTLRHPLPKWEVEHPMGWWGLKVNRRRLGRDPRKVG